MKISPTSYPCCCRQQRNTTALTSPPQRRRQAGRMISSRTKSWSIGDSYIFAVVLVVAGVFAGSCHGAASSSSSPGKPSSEKFFTNGWAVKVIGHNHHERVKRIAEKYGFDKFSKVRAGGI